MAIFILSLREGGAEPKDNRRSFDYAQGGRKEEADPSAHHPQTEKRLGPLSLRMTIIFYLAMFGTRELVRFQGNGVGLAAHATADQEIGATFCAIGASFRLSLCGRGSRRSSRFCGGC